MIIAADNGNPFLCAHKITGIHHVFQGDAGFVLQTDDLPGNAALDEHLLHHFGFCAVTVTRQSAAGHDHGCAGFPPYLHCFVNTAFQIVRRGIIRQKPMPQHHDDIRFLHLSQAPFHPV